MERDSIQLSRSSSEAVGELCFETGVKIPSSPRDVRAEGQRRLNQPSIALRVATAVAVGVGSFLRAVLAVGTLGVSEGIKALADKLVELYGTQKRGNDSISVLIPPSQEAFELDPKILPDRVAKRYNPETLEKVVQYKINKGHELVSQLLEGTLPDDRKCTVEDMTNIMFFVQVRGEEMNGGSFKDGAFTLPDPGQRIRQFLDTCPMSYQRDSSHITAFQTEAGAGQRGIDAYGSGKQLKEYLPHGMKTLLYGSVPQNSGSLKMPEDRLYLKIESHGAWLTRPRGGDEAAGPHRRGNHHDVGAFLGHSLSFIVTRFQKAGADTRKERLPTDLAKDYKNVMSKVDSGTKQLLERNAPLSTAGGIRIMMDNLKDGLRSTDPQTADHRLLKGIYDEIFKRYPDDFTARFGNEIVMLTQDIVGIDGERRVAQQEGEPPKPLQQEQTLKGRLVQRERENNRRLDEEIVREYDRNLQMSDQEMEDEIGRNIQESLEKQGLGQIRPSENLRELGDQDLSELDDLVNETLKIQSELEDLLSGLGEESPVAISSPTPTLSTEQEVIDTDRLLEDAIRSFDTLNDIKFDK